MTKGRRSTDDTVLCHSSTGALVLEPGILFSPSEPRIVYYGLGTKA